MTRLKLSSEFRFVDICDREGLARIGPSLVGYSRTADVDLHQLLTAARCDPQNLSHTEESALRIDMVELGAPVDYRDGPAFVEFLNKDAERINAGMKRIGKIE